MPERAVLWEPLAGVDYPCPRLEFQFHDGNDVRVVMRFSELNTGDTAQAGPGTTLFGRHRTSMSRSFNRWYRQDPSSKSKRGPFGFSP